MGNNNALLYLVKTFRKISNTLSKSKGSDLLNSLSPFSKKVLNFLSILSFVAVVV